MTLQQKTIIGLVMLAVTIASVAVGYSVATKSSLSRAATTESSRVSSPSAEMPVETGSATPAMTKQLLLYLIEEEKLAHDVYTKMYEKYGSRVFANILQSEQTHQAQVLDLLTSRGIADPRTNDLGTFNDQELQAFYDRLIEQGNQSIEEAYKVGIAIEQKDIADLNKQLETAADQDVITTLELLRRGSENHLRAFNTQLAQ